MFRCAIKFCVPKLLCVRSIAYCSGMPTINVIEYVISNIITIVIIHARKAARNACSGLLRRCDDVHCMCFESMVLRRYTYRLLYNHPVQDGRNGQHSRPNLTRKHDMFCTTG